MYKTYVEEHKNENEIVEGKLLRHLSELINVKNNEYLSYHAHGNQIGQPSGYPQYIRNPGIPIAKSTFDDMKKELISKNQNFWDSEFPCNNIKMPSGANKCTWKRPFEITPYARFFNKDVSRFDINQGKLGDCWVLSAMAGLAMFPHLFEKVVPFDQSFNKGDYCGMFRFRIWYYGQWIEIIIDDLLPTHENELMFIKSNDKNEFWSALLEKAYAKAYGSYANLKGGFTCEAMVDFTGGIVERRYLSGDPKLMMSQNRIDAFFYQILHAFNCFALMSVSKFGGLEELDKSGLLSRHAYTITAVCVVNTTGMGQAKLIRLRNPWGNETEWNGPWSDRSREWAYVHPSELQRLKINSKSDGEFWMCLNDFVYHFSRIEICYTHPQSMEDINQMENKEILVNKNWEVKMFYGEWVKGVNAGGSKKNYFYNPQFRLKIMEPDENSRDGTASVIVGLMQRNLRRFNKDLLNINYSIYRVDYAPQRMLYPNEKTSTTFIADSGDYMETREVSARHKLKPGNYIIIPSTYKENQERQFLIRIFSVKKTKATVLDQKFEMNQIASDTPKPKENEYDPAVLSNIYKHYSLSDSKMNADNLEVVLNKKFPLEPKYGALSRTTAKAAIFLFKGTHEEKINEIEFTTLWWYLLQWKAHFKKHDVNQDGQFNALELRSALGVKVNTFLMEKIVKIYGRRNKESNDQIVNFDSYIRCCIQLKSIFDQYQDYCKLPQLGNKMSLEEFLDRSLTKLIPS